jgi:CD109 antigen
MPTLEVQIRKSFPETWLWENFNDFGYEGQVTINKKVPDTITSWIITGFAIDPITGFGMTQNPRKLEVFQPFFVSTNLPYSIKRGEVVSIPIVVFNYMNEDVQAEVTLDNTLLEFEFADVDEATNDSKPKVELYRTRRVAVTSNNGASAAFMIRPKKTGYITIKVTATSSLAGDGVERQLLVEPEGVTNFVNKGFFIDLRESNEFETEIDIKLPRNIVPDSTKIQFSVIGDILGPTIKNLDKLIKLPYGCGEQNMLNFVPNIVILEYLKNTNQVTETIKTKSVKYMEKGYQRELTYKHPDGSFSAFGSKDGGTPGSTWLTAFVTKSFRQAADYIEIDDDVVKTSLNWLSNKQAPNGSFPEVGTVFHKGMQGGGGSGLALTAYVLTAFLQTQEDMTNYRNTISKSLDYILKNIETTDDIYSLAVTAYALQLAQHSSKTSVLQTLQSKAKDENGLIWWEKPKTSENEKKNPYYGEPSTVNVELTAYALLAYLEAGLVSESIPILKWLISQRNEEGGFASTQDTVVGIGALAKIGAKLSSPENNVQVTAKYNEEESALNIDAENAGVLQSREIPSSVRKVILKGTGRGIGMAQVSYKYNVNVTGAWPRFTLDPQVNKNSNPDYLSLTICTSYIPSPEENDLVSNMAVMEVKFVSGFTADLDTLPSLERSFGVQKVETKEDDTVVVMYFNNLDGTEICPTVTGFRTHKVANQKPAPVIIYDYYDNTRRARQFYHAPESTLCDICESDDCIEKCTPKAELQKSDDGPVLTQSGAQMLNSVTSITFALVLFTILFK